MHPGLALIRLQHLDLLAEGQDLADQLAVKFFVADQYR